MTDPAGVHDGARGADGGAKRRGQLFDEMEMLRSLEAAPTGDDDLRLRELELAHRRRFELRDTRAGRRVDGGGDLLRLARTIGCPQREHVRSQRGDLRLSLPRDGRVGLAGI